VLGLTDLTSICLLLVSGWLGGKMVYEAGVGVSTGEEAASGSPSRPSNRQGHT
jgi:uncharacterized membrane protein